MTTDTRCPRCRNRRSPGEAAATERACSGLLTLDQLDAVRAVGEGEPDAMCPACLTFAAAAAV